MNDAESQPSAESSRNPFRSAGFPAWWAASLVAGTGVGIQVVTVPLFVRDRVSVDERALAISAVLIAQNLPGAILALFGGTLADRMERRLILVRTYGVAAVVSVAYVFLAALDFRVIWPVFPLAMVVGAAGAFTNPARQSLLPQIVPRHQLQNGVILGTMGFMATLQFLGPTLGGVVTESLGMAVAFALEVGFLFTAAILFSGVRTGPSPPSGGSVVEDLLAGLGYLRTHPAILQLIVLALLPGVFFVGPFAVTIPLVVPDVFRAGDKWVGLLWGFFGAGVFCSSILLVWRPLARRGFAVCLSMVSGGLLLLLYGLSETLPMAAGLLFLWGVGAAVFINYVIALLQEHTEPQMMGRIMSMYSLAFFIGAPVGYLQAGLVTSAFGPQAALCASGLVAALIGLAFVLFLDHVRELP